MDTRKRIEEDVVREMKARNESVVSALRMLLAAIKNAEIEKREPLEESEVVDILGKEMKKLKDSLDSFESAGRDDLAAKTRTEMELLSSYLPEQLDDGALRRLVSKKVAELGEVTPKDFGRVMSEVMKEAKGQADGSQVSAVVKEMLTSG